MSQTERVSLVFGPTNGFGIRGDGSAYVIENDVEREIAPQEGDEIARVVFGDWVVDLVQQERKRDEFYRLLNMQRTGDEPV